MTVLTTDQIPGLICELAAAVTDLRSKYLGAVKKVEGLLNQDQGTHDKRLADQMRIQQLEGDIEEVGVKYQQMTGELEDENTLLSQKINRLEEDAIEQQKLVTMLNRSTDKLIRENDEIQRELALLQEPKDK